MAKSFVEEFIPQISSVDSVYSFFKGMGYKTLTKDYKTSLSSLGLRSKEKECIDDIYVVSNYDKRFQVYFIKLKSPSVEIIRSLSDLFLRSTHFPFLVFSSDFVNFSFVLVEKIRKDVGEFKRKLVKLNIDKDNLYHTDLEVLSNIKLEDETRPEDIYKKLREAFSVEKVTDKFFKEYVGVFNSVKDYLLKQAKKSKDAHNFTQQLLNRIMFIYFVAKKRWLGDDLKFMSTFWDIYCAGKKEKKYKPDTFYIDWLSVLFFEAFNNRFAPRQYFSKELNSILTLAPYLNGGLFTRNRLDDIGFELKDSIFEQIFTFFNRYNFTIREELPLEEEVAVDPEMIGRVYESLVNLSEESDERGEAGIFYTDRVEIDFMSRRSLVEYFCNQLQSKDVSKDLIYKFVFAKTEDEAKEIEKILTKHNLWQNIEEALDNLSVVDPACGSGSFLVGMLNILAGFYKLTYKNLNRPIDDFEIKKQIIGRSLYGVDVVEWACHVAELRLWLQLIVESELSLGDIKIKPLLPNLTFKIRPGDSLVQEIGGINLSLRNNRDLSPALKRKLTELKQEKLKFFNNDPSRKYQSEELLLHVELTIFRSIIDEKIQKISNQIKERIHRIGGPPGKELFSIEEVTTQATRQMHFDMLKEIREKEESAIKELNQEREHLYELRSTLDKESKPFVWDIDFVEIFADEFEGGFDIVIGNPPYVRQEKIADPNIPKEKITNENKRQYKEKLLHSVQNHFHFIKSLDKKSDLYVYFYFQGLALLNQTGTFCFITSNSWLDVGYGKDFQEFLLNNVKMHAIYDNSAKRSFARADVNTIIAVFSSPEPKEKKGNLENIVKFVMFRKPFDDVVTIDNLLKIEKVKEIDKTDDFRVYPKKQLELLEEGWEYPEDITEEQQKIYKFNIGKYAGNKWGGKYFRAPDIYFSCLQKQSKTQVLLKAYFEGERYLNSGGADGFFILTDVKPKKDFFQIFNHSKEANKLSKNPFLIKKNYLRPLIKDITKTSSKIEINNADAWVLVILDKDIDEETRKYIKFGEKIGFNKRSVTKLQKPWYKPTRQMLHSGKILFPRSFSDNHIIYYNPKELISLRFYRLYPKKEFDIIPFLAIFNSTYFALLMELNSPSNLGLGVCDVTMESFLRIKIPYNEDCVEPLKRVFKKISNRDIKSIFEELNLNPRLPIQEQEPNPLPDRKELDDIIFDILGLTKEERKEVYWAVCELVKNRLEKARSV